MVYICVRIQILIFANLKSKILDYAICEVVKLVSRVRYYYIAVRPLHKGSLPHLLLRKPLSSSKYSG